MHNILIVLLSFRGGTTSGIAGAGRNDPYIMSGCSSIDRYIPNDYTVSASYISEMGLWKG